MLLSDKRPYIIYRPAPGAGFWSNYSCVLQGLDEACHLGLTQVVDMERHATHYTEQESLDGTRNVWEYYFEQPAGLSLTEALRLDPLDNRGSTVGRFTSIPAVIPPAPLLARARELTAQFVRVKPAILADLNRILPPGVHREVLGVHVRGTDMRSGQAPRHAVSSAPAAYLDLARTLDREHRFSHIFLACDETQTVQMFRETFGTRLLTTQAHRTAGDQSLDHDYRWLVNVPRHLHRYQLGREVLGDALLLARCGHFVCGISNVSQSAQYFADERQTVHPLPPLWCAAEPRGPTLGRNYLASGERVSRPLSAPALAAQAEELRRLLEALENSRAEVQKERDHLQQRVTVGCRDLAEKQHALLEADQSLLTARLALSAAKEKRDRTCATLAELRLRITTMMNKWTWLGWRLRPWTKPSWRNNPLSK